MNYCDLIYTGQTFNNKKIYKCTECGLEAGLDSPDAKILCFAKSRDMVLAEIKQKEALNELADKDLEFFDNFHEKKEIPKELEKVIKTKHEAQSPEKTFLDEEQINSRMDICNSCEYYKDDACMLCGCRVVRDSVYQNKLADKNASCPDGRWGPIKD